MQRTEMQGRRRARIATYVTAISVMNRTGLWDWSSMERRCDWKESGPGSSKRRADWRG